MSILVSDVITYARQISQTDSNGLTDTLGLAFTNDAQQNFTRTLISHGIDAAQTQEAYTSMTTAGTYAWPSDMFALKTIELDYTGTGGQNYIQAQRVDVANLQGDTSFDYLRVNQPSNQPLFDNRGDTYEIFPTPGVSSSNGIKIFYFLAPTEFTATSAAISYPLTLDYRCISCRVGSLYSKMLDDYEGANILDKEYTDRINDIISILSPGSQQPIQPNPLHITGWNF